MACPYTFGVSPLRGLASTAVGGGAGGPEEVWCPGTKWVEGKEQRGAERPPRSGGLAEGLKMNNVPT